MRGAHDEDVDLTLPNRTDRRAVTRLTFAELAEVLGLPHDVEIVRVVVQPIIENVVVVVRGEDFPAIAVGMQEPVYRSLADIKEKGGEVG